MVMEKYNKNDVKNERKNYPSSSIFIPKAEGSLVQAHTSHVCPGISSQWNVRSFLKNHKKDGAYSSGINCRRSFLNIAVKQVAVVVPFHR